MLRLEGHCSKLWNSTLSSAPFTRFLSNKSDACSCWSGNFASDNILIFIGSTDRKSYVEYLVDGISIDITTTDFIGFWIGTFSKSPALIDGTIAMASTEKGPKNECNKIGAG